jgi:hypothetical protein
MKHNAARQIGSSAPTSRLKAVAVLLLFVSVYALILTADEPPEKQNVALSCNGEKKTIDLEQGAGAGIALQAGLDSACPIKVEGLPKIPDGTTLGTGSAVVGLGSGKSGETTTVTVTCQGEDENKKCNFSYFLFGPATDGTFSQAIVPTTKCNKANTTLALCKGVFQLWIWVDAKSDCPLTVKGLPSGEFTVEPGKENTDEQALVELDKSDSPDNTNVTMDCGSSDTKDCQYTYTLQKVGKRGKHHKRPERPK